MFRTAVLVAAAAVASAKSVTLTEANYESEVVNSGKTAFIKFYAPWCGHCKRMAPAWDKLGAEYKDHAKVVIGEVDCTTQKSLCSDVQGFPTIKHGSGGSLEDYEGGREYDDLAAFAANLKPSCSLANEENCNDDQKAFLNEWNAKSADERKAAIAEREAEIQTLKSDFEAKLKELQATYEANKKEMDAGIAAIKPNLALLKSL
eukprot:TRINITY_DN460_c0_g2_i1.p2 TRINITY_DN460_c0_g2~~TRINITY_DN460_c0_g2_i1.p2  ORF type:complete len:204 (+),score=97.55 TRINITY_DN460_c0_g2_i1:59-670(+)